MPARAIVHSAQPLLAAFKCPPAICNRQYPPPPHPTIAFAAGSDRFMLDVEDPPSASLLLKRAPVASTFCSPTVLGNCQPKRTEAAVLCPLPLSQPSCGDFRLCHGPSVSTSPAFSLCTVVPTPGALLHACSSACVVRRFMDLVNNLLFVFPSHWEGTCADAAVLGSRNLSWLSLFCFLARKLLRCAKGSMMLCGSTSF
jgi:hypothetical protein